LARIRSDDDSAGSFKRLSADDALSSEQDLIIFVSHNEEGSLVGPTGSHLDIDSLSKRCARALKLCVFLACNAKHYVSAAFSPAVSIEVEAREASKIARTIQTLAAQTLATIRPPDNTDPSLRPHPVLVIEKYLELVRAITAEVNAAGTATTAYWKLFYIKTATGVVAGVVVGLVMQGGDCTQKKCPTPVK
jgi:hypothetical protein